jgi:uncharacterized membrane protein YdbT with pleckstrin-like domain
MSGSRSERIRLDARRHGVVLAGPLARAALLAAVGAFVLAAGWPLTPLGALGLAGSAAIALRGLWRWQRTHLVVTDQRLYLEHGLMRRRSAGVSLGRIGPVEVEQTLVGRLLGYGTVVAGELEVPYVARPREVSRLLGS